MRALFVSIVLLCAVSTSAQQNPFTAVRPGTAPDSTATEVREGTVRSRLSWTRVPFAQELYSLQRGLVSKLSHSLRAFGHKPGIAGILILLALALFYGVVHSLGPGHGKLLFLSHTLARPSPSAKIWRAGALFAATHTGMAIIAFLVLRMLLGQPRSNIELYSQRMLKVSGVLIVLAGALVLASPLIEKMVAAVAHRLFRSVSNLDFLAVIAGLSPCPGAFLILVFSSISGVLYLGVLAVVAVSIGMAATVSAFGHLGGIVQAAIHKQEGNRTWSFLRTGLRYLGGVIIVAVGLLMFLC